MDGANPGLVVFDHEIPEELVRDLNDSYDSVVEPETIWPSSPTEPQVPNVPPKKGFSWKLKLFLVFTTSPMWIFMLAIIMEILGIYPFSTFQNEVVCAPVVTEPVPLPTSSKSVPSIRNLALACEGASILHGFTSPPALSSWISWSRLFEVEAECLIRPHMGGCWPLESDGAVGIGLGQSALVSAINVKLKKPPGIKQKDDFAEIAQTVVSVYGINDNGDQYLIAKSPPNSAIVSLAQPIQLSSLIIRTQITWQLNTPSPYACIDSIEVLGIPN